MSDEAADARAEIFRLMGSVQRFQLVRVAIELGLPAQFAAGALTTAELAAQLGIDSARLGRFLRGCCAAGLLRVEREHRFAPTAMMQELAATGPHSPSGYTRFTADFFHAAWAELPEWLHSGQTPFTVAHGQPLFELLAADEERRKSFTAAMTSHSGSLAEVFLAAANLPERGVLVDIGGGEGELVLRALQGRPEMSGVVFDLPSLSMSATARIDQTGFARCCRFEAGDMFESVPVGGDVYVLKWILHDWPDEAARRILGNIARTMRRDACLHAVERVMPMDPGEQTEHAIRDLNMAVLNGGRERTEVEYASLLAAAGLKLTSVVKLTDDFQLLTAHPANNGCGDC